MTADQEYLHFLNRAANELAEMGAGTLLPPDRPAGPNWAGGWEQVLLADNPGSPSVFAFGAADDGLEAFGRRLDSLASGLAGSGGSPRAPLKMIAVAVFTTGADPEALRRATKLAPSVFHANLRPVTWALDLRNGRLVTGRRFGSSEGAQLLERALGPGSASPMAAADLHAAHAVRTNAFYELMRGRQPLVTYGLIAVNVIIYLSIRAQGGADNPVTLKNFGAVSATLVQNGEWWRLFTSMFLHASDAHILFNMASLFAVGTLAERLYGSARYLAIYLGSGLIGSLTSVAFAIVSGTPDVLGVGASGAIFGVAGALVAVRFHPSDVIPQNLRNRVSASMLPLVVISLVFAALMQGVDNAAHIGGLLGGAGLSFLFPLTRSVPGVR